MSAVPPPEDRLAAAQRALLAARCVIEAVLFTCLTTMANQIDRPISAMPLLAMTFAFFGVNLIVGTWLTRLVSERASTGLVIGTAAAWATLGVALSPEQSSGLGILVRIIVFGIVGESWLWRLLSIARDPTQWHEGRNAVGFAAIALGIIAVFPEPLDKGPMPILALAILVAGAFSLSLSRAAEELRDTTATLKASAQRSGAGFVTLALGASALVAAYFLPSAEDAVTPVAEFLRDVVILGILAVAMPIAFLAAFIVEWLVAHLPERNFPDLAAALRSPLGVDDKALTNTAVADSAPWVFGVLAVFVGIIAALVGVILIDRIMRERREALPVGATIERESVEGTGLLDALRGLRGERPAPRRAPHSDGSPSATVRLLYWRFLALAERHGAGWRQAPETALEHAHRIEGADPLWRDAALIVDAFDTVRYGERDPDPAAVSRAREAYRRLENTRESRK